MGLKDIMKSGALGVLPAVASGALGKENSGFALGVLPGLMYRNRQRKKDAAGNEIPMTPQEQAQAAATGMKKGGKVKKMAAGGSASKRADGIAQRGKTKGRMV